MLKDPGGDGEVDASRGTKTTWHADVRSSHAQKVWLSRCSCTFSRTRKRHRPPPPSTVTEFVSGSNFRRGPPGADPTHHARLHVVQR